MTAYFSAYYKKFNFYRVL